MRPARSWTLALLGAAACGDGEVGDAAAGTGGAATSTSSVAGTTSTGPATSGSSGQGAGAPATTTGTGGHGGGGGSAPLAADGAPCTAHEACEGGVCLLEAVTGRPGGLCGSPCYPGDDTGCVGTCVYVAPFGTVCHAACADDPDVCRAGYACRTTVDDEAGYCAPACAKDADCVATGYCDEGGGCVLAEEDCEDLQDDNGDDRVDCADPSCAGAPACAVGVGAPGDPCTRNTDCASDAGAPLCLTEALTGYPGGACAQHCESGVEGIGADQCPSGFLCAHSLTFLANGAPGSSIGHCPVGTCAVDDPCRSGYACCSDVGCSYLRDSCVVGCTDDAQCVDTGNACASPQNGWPQLCAPPPPVEICDNGADDNDDYDADCDDDECDAFCAALATSLCAGAPLLAASQSGVTAPGPGIGYACIPSDVQGEVSPRVYQYLAATSGTLTLTLASVRPQVVAVVAGCDLETKTPVGCDKDADYDGQVEVTAEVEAGSTYFVLVWPMAPGHEDTYTLAAELP